MTPRPLTTAALRDLCEKHRANPGIVRGILQAHGDAGRAPNARSTAAWMRELQDLYAEMLRGRRPA